MSLPTRQREIAHLLAELDHAQAQADAQTPDIRRGEYDAAQPTKMLWTGYVMGLRLAAHLVKVERQHYPPVGSLVSSGGDGWGCASCGGFHPNHLASCPYLLAGVAQ